MSGVGTQSLPCLRFSHDLCLAYLVLHSEDSLDQFHFNTSYSIYRYQPQRTSLFLQNKAMFFFLFKDFESHENKLLYHLISKILPFLVACQRMSY